MSFGAEMRDFVAAFQVGSAIKDKREQRALEREQEKNRLAIAKAKEAAAESRFTRTQEGADRRAKENLEFRRGALKQSADQFQETMKFNQGKEAGVSSRADQGLANEAIRIDQNERRITDAEKNAEAARKKAEREQRLKDDPTAVLDEEPSAAPAQEAIPTGKVSPTMAERVVEASNMGVSPPIAVNYGLVATALDGGMKFLQEHFGLNKAINDGTAAAGGKALMEGVGAPTPEEIKAIDGILDPNNELPEQLKTTARLEALYEFYIKRGKNKEANAAAASLIQHSRGVASMFAHAAEVKLNQGDVAGAADQLVQMHDAIPDGRSVKFNRDTMSFQIIDDKSQEVVQEGQVTPELIMRMATAFKKGPEYFKVITEAAKRDVNFKDKTATGAQPKAEAPLKPLKPDERAALNEGVNETIHNEVLRNFKNAAGEPLFDDITKFEEVMGPEAMNGLSDLGTMIAGHNDVSPDKAARLALTITRPDKRAGSQEEQKWNGFKIMPESTNEVMVLKVSDGTVLKLPARVATGAIITANAGLFELAKKVVAEDTSKFFNEYEQNNIAAREKRAKEVEYNTSVSGRAAMARKVKAKKPATEDGMNPGGFN